MTNRKIQLTDDERGGMVVLTYAVCAVILLIPVLVWVGGCR